MKEYAPFPAVVDVAMVWLEELTSITLRPLTLLPLARVRVPEIDDMLTNCTAASSEIARPSTVPVTVAVVTFEEDVSTAV